MLPDVPVRGFLRSAHHPGFQREPLRVRLRSEVLASVVEKITARGCGQRVHEELALQAAWHDHSPHGLEVLAGIFLVPGRGAGGEWLETHTRSAGMTRDTPGVTRSLRQEDRLNSRLEKVIANRRRR